MIAEKIQQILKNKSIKTYIGDLPAAPANAVGIMLYTGGYNTEYFHKGTLSAPIAKIVVRNTSYKDASDLIEHIKSTLHRYHDESLLSVIMQGNPSYLGRDPQKLHTFQIIFKIRIKE